MNRRTFLQGMAALPLLSCKRARPNTTNSEAVIEPYFPSAAHKLVWRNWDLVPAERIAAVLKCQVDAVTRLAVAMGLEPTQTPNRYESRTWFKVLRRNWDFVPFSQLTVLLNIPEAELRAMMIHFYFVKNHLGPEPKCPEVRLDDSATVSGQVIPHFRSRPVEGIKEDRFAFLEAMKRPIPEIPWQNVEGQYALTPRILFPYSAIYGDVLSQPDFESWYPPEVLQNIARMGLDSIWLHEVLHQLLPSKIFPEFGKESALRLRRLNALIKSAKQHGLNVYLYLNEPRGMPEEFFEKYPDIKGAEGRPIDGCFSMCTSTQPVRDYLMESSQALFANAPDLKGVILITASEAPTNCYSICRQATCPRCSKRKGPEVIGEVIRLIEKGARKAKPSAHIIAWDWSWTMVEEDPQQEIINNLPDTVTLMVDFERGTPIDCKGVRSTVDEYCLSVVGPSPRADAHIRQARERNMPVMAKVQVGNTWELGLLPFVPVPSLVARKFQALLEEGISGTMQSWTSGTYPSLNWQVAKAFYKKPPPNIDLVLREVASARYGKKAAPRVLQAWKIFAETFQQYPFSNSLVYSSVVQNGPAHPMYFEPTGKTDVIMNSYDSLSWTQPFGPEIVSEVFAEMAAAWQPGLKKLEQALSDVPPAKRDQALKDIGISRAVFLYFKSISNQVRFLMLREQWEGKNNLLEHMKDLVEEEIDLATQFYRIVCSDSRIGFESSLQYFYMPLDIRERIISCRYMLDKQMPEAAKNR